MAEIVLVHGIDQQQKSSDKLESVWLPALAGGVRGAGFNDVADRIWRSAGTPGSIDTRMAFYGSLFLSPGQQGDELCRIHSRRGAVRTGSGDRMAEACRRARHQGKGSRNRRAGAGLCQSTDGDGAGGREHCPQCYRKPGQDTRGLHRSGWALRSVLSTDLLLRLRDISRVMPSAQRPSNPSSNLLVLKRRC